MQSMLARRARVKQRICMAAIKEIYGLMPRLTAAT